jgi:hypothetical protein
MNDGTKNSNPAGLIYRLDLAYGDDCEECYFVSDCEESCDNLNVSNNKGNPDNIFTYNSAGTLVNSFDLSLVNTSSQGVATTDDYIYVIDLADKKAHRYDCCGNEAGVSRRFDTSAGSSIGNPNGLAIYGADDEIWVVSANDKKIYGYSLAAAYLGTGTPLSPVTEIPLVESNTGAAGLAVNDCYLFVLDDDKVSGVSVDVIYRYPKHPVPPEGDPWEHPECPDPREDPPPVRVSKILQSRGNPLAAGDGDRLDLPSGAMIDNDSIWVVDRGTDKVYQYDLDELFDEIGSVLDAIFEFPLDSANSKATGL